MPTSSASFALPATLETDLATVHAHWTGLERADNPMPFWDDLKLSALADVKDQLFLVDAFADPQRFRFNMLGKSVTEHYGRAVQGQFVDEVDLHAPFDDLGAQCAATIETRAPTYFAGAGYARILLPMWGDGRIGLLLGAVALR